LGRVWRSIPVQEWGSGNKSMERVAPLWNFIRLGRGWSHLCDRASQCARVLTLLFCKTL